jgi:glycosyltransferase involved in cell wall biosynthesis
MPFLLSIVIPVYNEERTLEELVDRVRAAELPSGMQREIILVDDASGDGTRQILQRLVEADPSLKVIYHESNQGKGGALHTGFAAATGTYVLIQDADLEYDPADYPRLLAPILKEQADVVIGTRFHGEALRALTLRQRVANRVITFLSNIATRLPLSDVECCYKVIPTAMLQRITLLEKRFGFEPEVVAKLARLGARFHEVKISYRGRSYADGKKIGVSDGFRALYCIVRYRFFA